MTDPNKPDQNASDDDWEKAMAEQQGEEAGGDDADPWAEALAEQLRLSSASMSCCITPTLRPSALCTRPIHSASLRAR